MADNKIELADGTVLIDLTEDTVNSSSMLRGITAHDASGETITGTMAKIYYGTCDTAASSASKIVSCSDFDILASGCIILVNFTYANGASNPTLNVNSTGAKPILIAGNTAPSSNSDGSWIAGTIRSFRYNGAAWVMLDWAHTGNDMADTLPSAYCLTGSSTDAKVAACTNYKATENCWIHLLIFYSNSSASALTLNINKTGAKPLYINGQASSDENYTLPGGTYLVFYDGTNYYIRTDGKLPGSISGDSATVNGHTVLTDVPANAVFTDTTYNNATTSAAGLMSATDKAAVDLFSSLGLSFIRGI